MKKCKFLLTLTLLIASTATFAKVDDITLKSAESAIVYSINDAGALYLKKVTNKSTIFPMSGQLFPSQYRPLGYSGNGVRYEGALTIDGENKETVIELKYQSHTLTTERDGVELLTITLLDSSYPITVKYNTRVYKNYNVFEQWTQVINNSNNIIELPRVDAMYWQANATGGVFLEWYPSKQAGEFGKRIQEKLSYGKKSLECRDGIRHKEGPQPEMVIGFGDYPNEDSTPCMLVAFGWSGSSKFSYEINSDNQLETSISVLNHYGAPKVKVGESLDTPPVYSILSSNGKGEASRYLHRWVRSELMPAGDQIRPIDNNSWEGCFMNVNEESVTRMMKDSKELGIELYVLDDGWFADKYARNKDISGLGDWFENPKKLPNGIEALVKVANKEGLEFGLWFEPEMVNPESELAKNHPNWLMTMPNKEISLQRTQLTLDVANPEVQDFMFETIDKYLSKKPSIKFIKWDVNANINNPYSPYLGDKYQGNMLYEYMNGYYSVLERLTTKYPNVFFQTCSSGGGRSDFGALKYSHTHWISDNTAPNHRIVAQWNASIFIPAMATTAHVTHAPRNSVAFRPKYRFDISMMAQLGMEVDTRKCDTEYLNAAKTGIEAYKSVRDIVQLGDLYRHQNPFDSEIPSLNFVSQDKTRCLLLAYQTGEINGILRTSSKIDGLDPKKNYKVTEINLPEQDSHPRLDSQTAVIKSGTEWMGSGVPLVYSRQFDSAAILFTEVEKPK